MKIEITITNEEIELIKDFYHEKQKENSHLIYKEFSGSIESLETAVLSALKDIEKIVLKEKEKK